MPHEACRHRQSGGNRKRWRNKSDQVSWTEIRQCQQCPFVLRERRVDHVVVSAGGTPESDCTMLNSTRLVCHILGDFVWGGTAGEHLTQHPAPSMSATVCFVYFVFHAPLRVCVCVLGGGDNLALQVHLNRCAQGARIPPCGSRLSWHGCPSMCVRFVFWVHPLRLS